VVAAACTRVLNIGQRRLAVVAVGCHWPCQSWPRAQHLQTEKEREGTTSSMKGTVGELRSRRTSIVTRLRHRPTQHGTAVNMAVAGPSSSRV
jgi:hypothetical protein